jgi:hypothetical protein
VAAIDPHFSAVYRLGSQLALRATYDHTTVAPKPLEADRTDTANPAPFVPLDPETANVFTYSLEGGRRTQFRLTYYSQFEQNRIDVLPVNFRSVASGGTNPSGIGVPTNAGALQAHGVELWLRNGGFTLDSNYISAFSSSASQFAYNGLNTAAVVAGHLFPVSYVPNFTTTLSYDVHAGKHVRVVPSISYQTGYPYGNGKDVWILDPTTNKPELVPNDNYQNPGYNYYFLRDPSQPYNAATNPYIGNLGTPEGADPNTLRSTPQLLVNLHAEADIAKRVTAVFDVVNLFRTATPTAYQGNPYLIGPPGYTGGNPLYAIAYQNAAGFAAPYTLGNGVPTNDGVHQAVPWTYGTAGYVPQSYPAARSFQIGLKYAL